MLTPPWKFMKLKERQKELGISELLVLVQCLLKICSKIIVDVLPPLIRKTRKLKMWNLPCHSQKNSMSRFHHLEHQAPRYPRSNFVVSATSGWQKNIWTIMSLSVGLTIWRNRPLRALRYKFCPTKKRETLIYFRLKHPYSIKSFWNI